MTQTVDDHKPSEPRVPVRLLVVDVHLLFRECLTAALLDEGRFEVVDRADDIPQALACLSDQKVDVLLVVLNGSGREIVGQTREAVTCFPGLRILILTDVEVSDLAIECLKAGAGGVLSRNQSVSDLRSAIEGVAGGGRKF